MSNSSVPYKGVVEITTENGTKNVCWESLKNNAGRVFCQHLGYYSYMYTLVNISNSWNIKDSLFSGSIKCDSKDKYLSQCSVNASFSKRCSELVYVECK